MFEGISCWMRCFHLKLTWMMILNQMMKRRMLGYCSRSRKQQRTGRSCRKCSTLWPLE